MTSVDPKTTIRGILDALREDIDDEASWNALMNIDEETEFKQVMQTHDDRHNLVWNACSHIAREGKSQIECVQFHHNGYAEPGYTDPASGIIATGNWNSVTKYEGQIGASTVLDDTPELLSDLLEKLGVEIEWFDEWADCDECGKLVRTQPDGWDWHPSYQVGDGWLECDECCSKRQEMEAELNQQAQDYFNEPEEENPFEFDDPSVNPMA